MPGGCVTGGGQPIVKAKTYMEKRPQDRKGQGYI